MHFNSFHAMHGLNVFESKADEEQTYAHFVPVASHPAHIHLYL
jgi:hypothetical protein